MSAEYIADKLIDYFIDDLGADCDTEPTENVLDTGGYFFTLTYRGRHYEISVTEVTAR